MQLTQDAWAFKVNDRFDLGTLANTKSLADLLAKRYYANNPNWYEKGAVVAIQIVQKPEFA